MALFTRCAIGGCHEPQAEVQGILLLGAGYLCPTHQAEQDALQARRKAHQAHLCVLQAQYANSCGDTLPITEKELHRLEFARYLVQTSRVC